MESDSSQSSQESSGTHGVDGRLARNGALSYLEIPALEPRRSAAFYAQVLGWTLDERTSDDIRFSDPAGQLIGRWVPGREACREPGLLPYVYVDHIDEAVGRVVRYGGEVIGGPDPEGNLRVATVRDPAGNVIGLWEAQSVAQQHPQGEADG